MTVPLRRHHRQFLCNSIAMYAENTIDTLETYSATRLRVPALLQTRGYFLASCFDDIRDSFQQVSEKTARKEKFVETGRTYYYVIVISIMAREEISRRMFLGPLAAGASGSYTNCQTKSTFRCPCLHVKLFKRLSVNSLRSIPVGRKEDERRAGPSSPHEGDASAPPFCPLYLCLFRRTFAKVSSLFASRFTDLTLPLPTGHFQPINVNETMYLYIGSARLFRYLSL